MKRVQHILILLSNSLNEFQKVGIEEKYGKIVFELLFLNFKNINFKLSKDLDQSEKKDVKSIIWFFIFKHCC